MRLAAALTLLILCIFRISATASEPTLTLTEERRGTWIFTGMGDPPVELNDQVNCGEVIPWVFSWTAEPNSPGTSVTEFRYGWDIADPADPLQWMIDWTTTYTAPPLHFYFGTHTFMIEARDNLGAVTRGTINMNIQPVSDPTLTVTEYTRGEWLFIGMGSPDVLLTDPLTNPVTPWDVEWSAMPCAPGTSVSEYRYGWDIVDPGDDNQWTPWGPATSAPPRSFLIGNHSLMIEARDDVGVVTRGTIIFEVIPGSSPVKSSTWGGIKSLYLD